MQITRFPTLPYLPPGSVVFIGDFDGIHAAHRAVLREPLERRAWVGAVHQPASVRSNRLNRLSGVARGLTHAGVNAVVIASPQTKTSTISTLLNKSSNVVDIVSIDSMNTTAATIRDAINQGEISMAQQLLGGYPEIEGRIANGDKRGRTIGFATANIHLGPLISPKHGVYAVRAKVGDSNAWINGVANMGIRPTFGGKPPVLEAHLFDFNEDIYRKSVRIQLIDMIRAEKKFDGIDALKAQIARDCDTAREYLANAGPL